MWGKGLKFDRATAGNVLGRVFVSPCVISFVRKISLKLIYGPLQNL